MNFLCFILEENVILSYRDIYIWLYHVCPNILKKAIHRAISPAVAISN